MRIDYVDCVESDDFSEGLKDFVDVIYWYRCRLGILLRRGSYKNAIMMLKMKNYI